MRQKSWLSYGVYDKRDVMTCFAETRTFPHVDTVLAESVKRAVLIGEIHRYDRRTSTKKAFVDRVVMMAGRMIRHGYPTAWISSALQSYRKLLPGKGDWGQIRVEIWRRIQPERSSR